MRFCKSALEVRAAVFATYIFPELYVFFLVLGAKLIQEVWKCPWPYDCLEVVWCLHTRNDSIWAWTPFEPRKHVALAMKSQSVPAHFPESQILHKWLSGHSKLWSELRSYDSVHNCNQHSLNGMCVSICTQMFGLEQYLFQIDQVRFAFKCMILAIESGVHLPTPKHCCPGGGAHEINQFHWAVLRRGWDQQWAKSNGEHLVARSPNWQTFVCGSAILRFCEPVFPLT